MKLSSSDMLGSQPSSSTQWQAIWLDKFSDLLIKLEYPVELRKAYWAVAKRYLVEHPGNPRSIPVEKLSLFISSDPENRKPPLVLFYEHLSRSLAHLNVLQTSGAASMPEPLPHPSQPDTKQAPKAEPASCKKKPSKASGKTKTGKIRPDNT